MARHHGAITKQAQVNEASTNLEKQLMQKTFRPVINTINFPKAPVAPNFPNCYVDWVIETYQPLNTCEGEKFRRMCNELNPKVCNLGKDKVSQVLAEKEATGKATLIRMVKGQYISLTTDGWTSLANESYTAQTGQILYLII